MALSRRETSPDVAGQDVAGQDVAPGTHPPARR